MGQIIKSLAPLCMKALLRLQYLLDSDEILRSGSGPQK